MPKTFTCKELGGICDEAFSGESLMEIMQKGMTHMQADPAHIERMMNLSKETGETKEQWMTRMQGEFDAKEED